MCVLLPLLVLQLMVLLMPPLPLLPQMTMMVPDQRHVVVSQALDRLGPPVAAAAALPLWFAMAAGSRQQPAGAHQRCVLQTAGRGTEGCGRVE